MTVLSTHNLSKSYKGRQVVHNTSLRVASGQIVGLLGPNGAGKTTAFYMIIGLIKPDDGQILLDDEDISMAPMHIRARKGIGYLPQEASIFRKLSVSDNIMAILEARTGLTSSDRDAKLSKLLEELNISHLRISVNDIKSIIRALSGRGIGILITDHNVRETLDICELAYIFNAGSVLAEGTPAQILQNRQVREVYLGEQFRM